MPELERLHAYATELDQRLRLGTYPLAVKLFEKGEALPRDAKRPLRDLGYHLSACQALAMSRRQQVTMALSKEDMWCPEPVIGFGLAEAPAFFLEGHNRYPGSVATLEAGARWARGFPHLEAGRYVTVVSAPLVSADFEPDVIVIYGNPAQTTQLVLAAEFKEGSDLVSPISGRAACVYAVAPVMLKGQYQITLPCPGDRQKASAQDDEMIFSVPTGKLGELMDGMRSRDQYIRGQPTSFTLMPEYPLPEIYTKLGKLMGMRFDKGK